MTYEVMIVETLKSTDGEKHYYTYTTLVEGDSLPSAVERVNNSYRQIVLSRWNRDAYKGKIESVDFEILQVTKQDLAIYPNIRYDFD